MIRNLITLVLFAFIIFGFTGCSGSDSSAGATSTAGSEVPAGGTAPVEPAPTPVDPAPMDYGSSLHTIYRGPEFHIKYENIVINDDIISQVLLENSIGDVKAVNFSYNSDTKVLIVSIRRNVTPGEWNVVIVTPNSYTITNHIIKVAGSLSLPLTVYGDFEYASGASGEIHVEAYSEVFVDQVPSTPAQCYMVDANGEAFQIGSSFYNDFVNEAICYVPAGLIPGAYTLIVTTEFGEAGHFADQPIVILP